MSWKRLSVLAKADLEGIAPAEPAAHANVTSRMDRVVAELEQLRVLVGQAQAADHVDSAPLREGVAEIQEAISQTRGEIATLHSKAMRNHNFNRATDELDAVVADTESATETILSSAEAIDEIARRLMKNAEGDAKASIVDICANAVRIFEACNFQDISGQRISKVVGLLKFIEDRVGSMLEIWGGIETAHMDAKGAPELVGDEALLNGPALSGDIGVVSQDDIDSLFA